MQYFKNKCHKGSKADMEVIFQSGILFAEMYHLMQAHRKRLLSLNYNDVYKVLSGYGII